ncbi:MAG: hypothetical protein JWN08_3369, partial [Frankiales bacterium]|nr:hypothetical protein [Frankiales bacterium]
MSTDDAAEALQRRIEQLAALVDDAEAVTAAPGVDLSGLRTEMAGVRADVGSLRAEMGAVRA